MSLQLVMAFISQNLGASRVSSPVLQDFPPSKWLRWWLVASRGYSICATQTVGALSVLSREVPPFFECHRLRRSAGSHGTSPYLLSHVSFGVEWSPVHTMSLQRSPVVLKCGSTLRTTGGKVLQYLGVAGGHRRRNPVLLRSQLSLGLLTTETCIRRETLLGFRKCLETFSRRFYLWPYSHAYVTC